ncbi:MAG: outer membrane beta-barrel protein [Acidobacteriota bacterium]
MRQKVSPAIFMLALCLFFNNNQITAQSKTPKYEIGAQFSLFRFSDLDLDRGVTEPGFGGRFTYNINDRLAVEAEMNFFPKERRVEEVIFGFGGEVLQGGHKTQGLFGIKAGARKKRIGVFGKVRPGFVHFSRFEREGFACILEVQCPPNPPPRFSETDFALDLGGVVELYPARRVVVRLDIGDTIIHSNSGELIVLPGSRQFPNGTRRSVRNAVRSTSHNLQFSVGVGLRF